MSRTFFRRLVFVVFLGAASPAVRACLWDYDTLRDERRGLPGIAEVLAGKWEKHSKFFYEKRVEKMKALLAREPGNLGAYDNLAVAYEKLNDQDSAIEAMRAKEKITPGEYTTEANLGTFYLHKGDLPAGIDHIRKALQINPNAHFGRKEYQLKLAEFMLVARTDPAASKQSNFLGLRPNRIHSSIALTTMPAEPDLGPDTLPSGDLEGEDQYWASLGYPGRLTELGVKNNALEGIVGIIRFGTGTSAELYLTLGDLLALRGDKNLAYRAYQRALDFDHPRDKYIKHVMAILRDSIYEGADIAPEKIAAERAASDAWVKAYQDNEDDLLRRGKDTDDEANYAAFYTKYGPRDEDVRPTLKEKYLTRDRDVQNALVWGLAAVVVCSVAILFVFRNSRRRRVPPKPPSRSDSFTSKEPWSKSD